MISFGFGLQDQYPDTRKNPSTANPLDAFDSALRIMGFADILIPQHDPCSVYVKSIP
jgi:hypothetical protein